MDPFDKTELQIQAKLYLTPNNVLRKHPDRVILSLLY